MNKKFKYSLRDMIVVKHNDAGNIITLGMIVDLFMDYILDIMPFNRFGLGAIADEGYSMDRDTKRLYKRSFKLCKKIERCFIQKLAHIYVAQAFVVSYSDVVDLFYDSIEFVTNHFYFGKDKALYTLLREFSLPSLFSSIEDYEYKCAYFGFTTNIVTTETPAGSSY